MNAPSSLIEYQDLVGTSWIHFKGGRYEVIQVAFRERDRSLEIVYRDLTSGDVFVRPYDEFMDGRFQRSAASK